MLDGIFYRKELINELFPTICFRCLEQMHWIFHGRIAILHIDTIPIVINVYTTINVRVIFSLDLEAFYIDHGQMCFRMVLSISTLPQEMKAMIYKDILTLILSCVSRLHIIAITVEASAHSTEMVIRMMQKVMAVSQ